MSLKEKLFVMETLWDDIAASEAELEVPAWQQNLLDERESAIAAGTVRFIDWEDAKREIREAVR